MRLIFFTILFICNYSYANEKIIHSNGEQVADIYLFKDTFSEFRSINLINSKLNSWIIQENDTEIKYSFIESTNKINLEISKFKNDYRYSILFEVRTNNRADIIKASRRERFKLYLVKDDFSDFAPNCKNENGLNQIQDTNKNIQSSNIINDLSARSKTNCNDIEKNKVLNHSINQLLVEFKIEKPKFVNLIKQCFSDAKEKYPVLQSRFESELELLLKHDSKIKFNCTDVCPEKKYSYITEGEKEINICANFFKLDKSTTKLDVLTHELLHISGLTENDLYFLSKNFLCKLTRDPAHAIIISQDELQANAQEYAANLKSVVPQEKLPIPSSNQIQQISKHFDEPATLVRAIPADKMVQEARIRTAPQISAADKIMDQFIHRADAAMKIYEASPTYKKLQGSLASANLKALNVTNQSNTKAISQSASNKEAGSKSLVNNIPDVISRNGVQDHKADISSLELSQSNPFSLNQDEIGQSVGSNNKPIRLENSNLQDMSWIDKSEIQTGQNEKIANSKDLTHRKDSAVPNHTKVTNASGSGGFSSASMGNESGSLRMMASTSQGQSGDQLGSEHGLNENKQVKAESSYPQTVEGMLQLFGGPNFGKAISSLNDESFKNLLSHLEIAVRKTTDDKYTGADPKKAKCKLIQNQVTLKFELTTDSADSCKATISGKRNGIKDKVEHR